MRKLFFIILLCFITICAGAEIPCQCGQETCKCFIQLGDEGPAVECIQHALIAQGYLAKNADGTVFDQRSVDAVIHFQTANGLPPTGMMDDETLTLLLWGMLPEELDDAEPFSSRLTVWIPTDGGKRHHRRPTCCKMLDPRQVSQRNALKMEMLHCGHCKPDGYVKK